jgi:putative ABC transport system ATP-binding protein
MRPTDPGVPPQPPSRPALEADACFVLRNISKTYAGEENTEIQALKALSVTIPWNARVGILGLSGAGKSTLLSILGLLDGPDRDTADAAGADILYAEGRQAWSYLGRSAPGIVPLSHAQTDQFRRRHFGFVFQSGHLLGYLACDENVALGRTLRGESRPDRRKEARALLESVGLKAYFRSRPRSLSGGQAQRVAALRALCHSPRVILADEPTGHLDAHNARLVLDRVLDWQRSSPGQEPRTLLLVTHDLHMARRYCDRFLILNEGRLVRGRLIRADEVSGESVLLELLSETANEDHPGAGDRPDQATTVCAPIGCTPSGEEMPAERTADEARSIASFDLARFALKDIVRRDDLLSTASGWLSLVLLTVLSLVGWGFMRAKSELVERELQNPLACALNIDCLDATTEMGIDDRQVGVMAQLRLADGRMAVDPRSGGVKRWNIVRRVFWKGNSDPPAQVDRTLEGRSVDPKDPLLSTEPSRRILCFLPEPRFHGFSTKDTAREMVVTSSLLAECGYPPDAKEILVDYQNQPVPLAIVGIVDSIPGGYQFLLTNRFLQLIQSDRLVADPNVDHVEIGPLAAEKRQRAIALVSPGLREKNLELSSSQDGHGLEFRVARGGLLPYSTLRKLAEKLARKIEKAGLAKDGTLQVPLAAPQEEPPRDPLYMGCTLYLADVYDHEEVYQRLTNDPRLRGLKADARFMDLIGRMRRTLKPLGLMLGGVVGCAVVVALINLSVMMLQRVQRRRNEIGVLKACGMTNHQLVVLYAIEGIVLGGTAAALSLPLASGAGRVFASYAAHDSTAVEPTKAVTALVASCAAQGSAAAGESTLFHVTPAMNLIVVAVILIMCTVACLVATRQVVHVEPAQTLR